MKLYKFKSVDGLGSAAFCHLLDVLEKERLFCPTIDMLNDPFEGFLGFRDLETKKTPDRKFIERFICHRENQREAVHKYGICSLSNAATCPLMWGHYTNGMRGVCIEIELDADSPSLYQVQYVDDIESLNIKDPLAYLTQKLTCWRYENEYRLITRDTPPYIDVPGAIKTVYIGARLNPAVAERLGEVVAGMGQQRPRLAVAGLDTKNGRVELK